MNQLNRLLYETIYSVRTWQKNLSDIPDSVWRSFRLYIQTCNRFGILPPTDITSFIRRLEEPVSSWQFPEIEKLIPLDTQIIDGPLGLSIAAEDYLQVANIPTEFEQDYMKQILVYCREHDLDERYRMIRTFLSKKENAVISFAELQYFLMEIREGKVRELVENCYEKVTDLQSYKQCPHCHWTLEMQDGEWRCNRWNVCQAYWEGTSFQSFVEDGQIYYRQTPGIQRYVLIPGLAEMQIGKELEKKGYQITMYPEVDLYDILAEGAGESWKIDVKDYRKPQSMVQYLLKEVEKEDWDPSIIYVIPNKHVRDIPSYLQQVAGFLNRRDINVMSTNQLLRKVGVAR